MKLLALLFLFLFLGQAGYSQPITIPLTKAPKYKKPEPPKFDSKTPLYLDARPLFEFSMGHLDKSQSIRFQDYSETLDARIGLLDPGFGQTATRLTSLGVHPSRVTYVLGDGRKGRGEEGRIAWMLLYLGIKDVRVFAFETFAGKRRFGDKTPTVQAPSWKPKIKTDLRIRIDELKPLVVVVQGQSVAVSLVDVRSLEEFKEGHLNGAVHISWENFMDENGNPLTAEKVRELLIKHQLSLDKPLIFYSDKGVRSAFATYVTHRAGLKARLFDGGLTEWRSDSTLSLVK